MPNIGPAEIIVILVIALLVLGPKKLPEVGKSLGKGIREFKDSISSSDDSHDDEPILPRERRAPAQVGAPPPVDAPVATQSVAEDR
jgi:sec-independent protein translocase protein TatA